MNNIEMLPSFKYDLNHPFGVNYGCITAGSHVVHRIDDPYDFYEALGYTEEMQKNGVLPEEFIWSAYHKDAAKMEEACLQAHIVEYLKDNSSFFLDQYGYAYQNWIGSCTSKFMNNSDDCLNCKKHPHIPDVSECNHKKLTSNMEPHAPVGKAV